MTGNGAFNSYIFDIPYSATFVMLSPLMPEIITSKQRILPRFFTHDFKFYCLFLEKKVYLINFSFKFNEMKFYSVLMNW